MDSIFEKTMRACLESKKATKTAKKLKESRRVVEDEFSDEFTDIEIDDTSDNDAIMPGIDTDVVVVVDPNNVDDGDYVDPAIAAAEIVDDTPDGEIPYTDEFIGDFTYTCPICGNTFFSDVEMHDGDECPVCGDTPNGYVLVGQVEATPAQEDEPTTSANADEKDDEELADDETEDSEDTSISVDADGDGDEDLEINVDTAEEETESKKVCPKCGKEGDKCECDKAKKETRRVRRTSVAYKIDESTFNPFMTKFIRDNYKNARKFEMKSAKINGRVLTIECMITFNSGKQKRVTMKAANFNPKSESLTMRDDGFFKCESKSSAPFVFKMRMEGRVIKCEGMKYNFVTRMTEGKRVQIYGSLARKAKMESKRNFRNGARK